MHRNPLGNKPPESPMQEPKMSTLYSFSPIVTYFFPLNFFFLGSLPSSPFFFSPFPATPTFPPASHSSASALLTRLQATMQRPFFFPSSFLQSNLFFFIFSQPCNFIDANVNAPSTAVNPPPHPPLQTTAALLQYDSGLGTNLHYCKLILNLTLLTATLFSTCFLYL